MDCLLSWRTRVLYLKGKFVNVIRRACEEHRFYNIQAKEFGGIIKIEIEEV